ncbi:hypothetical protein A3K86_20575 [Photobacterium jeanii]|uniref:Uncharacterized protein n=1 Tax=Photobacterium jeanii TaxID=858640 RepID=A0A178K2K4_9GAMM|nr:hypothetical protein [Photobacterium jeanii]OAN11347.1 hypothetical protein A3K86_20575 [Photobacterium jeanii]PST90866.1 hypothetical protein C9I91_09680 [Photobacterium jeanii]
MAKYQFFRKEDGEKAFTFLNSESVSFSEEKSQLLDQGFVVDGDYVYADTQEEAIERYKSNFLYLSGEYAASTTSGSLYYVFSEAIKWLKRK